jgi:hypothetical protein
MGAGAAREAAAYSLGVQAVQWGMQWVKGGLVFRAMAAPLPEGASRPAFDPFPHAVNVWGHARELITHEFRTIETPNTETLYSTALLDLADGPVIAIHPDFAGRYYRTSIWEGHGDTHTIGERTYGSQPPPLAIVPIGWAGDLPAGVEPIRVRSRYVNLGPHVAFYGHNDLANVHELQKGLKLYDLAGWASGTELAAGPPMRPARRPGTATPPELMFFEELCEMVKDLTIRDDEAGFARQLHRIGITLGDGFQFGQLDEPTVNGLKRAVLDGQSILQHKAQALAPPQPGGTWLVGFGMTSVDDWLLRGAIGWGYVWGDDDTEILFPMARQDANGDKHDGSKRYRLRFPPGEHPPARYWRISMYDNEGFFTDNPIHRYGIGNMAERLDTGTDGSLTITIQHDSPGPGNQTNWLPAPAGEFFMVLRMYQPEDRMYNGHYTVPPVEPSG